MASRRTQIVMGGSGLVVVLVVLAMVLRTRSAVPVVEEGSPVEAQAVARGRLGNSSAERDPSAKPKTAFEEARDKALATRLKDPKLIELVKLFGTNQRAKIVSKEGREKFNDLAKGFSRRGLAAERMMREAYLGLRGREMGLIRMALLEGAIVGQMDPGFLKELGALELSYLAEESKGKALPAVVKEVRLKLLSLATAATLAPAGTFADTESVFSITLRTEQDPMARVRVIQLYLLRYPAEKDAINEVALRSMQG